MDSQPQGNLPQGDAEPKKEPVVKQSAKIEKEMGHLEQKLSKFEEEAHNQMQALEFTELKHMEEDEAYLKDFGLSTPQFMHLDKLHEQA